MNENKKNFIEFDINDGLSLIKVGLNSIINTVLETKEPYIIYIPISGACLADLIVFSIEGAKTSFRYPKLTINLKDCDIQVTIIASNFKFELV